MVVVLHHVCVCVCVCVSVCSCVRVGISTCICEYVIKQNDVLVFLLRVLWDSSKPAFMLGAPRLAPLSLRRSFLGSNLPWRG